jgi:hypothetical protein
MAYLGVLVLLLCVTPLAFVDSGGDEGGRVVITWRVALCAVPVLAALFVARTATIVSAAGIRVRASFGSRTVRWDEVRGLSIQPRAIYAVLADGSLRLPCVHNRDLAAISTISGSRLPEIAEPQQKYAPGRRRR